MPRTFSSIAPRLTGPRFYGNWFRQRLVFLVDEWSVGARIREVGLRGENRCTVSVE